MARLTLTDARNLMLKGRPWTFRMEFQGANPAVKSGWSTKFWLATGRGRHEPVEIHYGVIGSAGTILVKDWDYVEAKAPEKEAEGYNWADTPFVRVQQSTISGGAPRVPIRAPPPPAVVPAPAPAPIPAVPLLLAPQSNTPPGPWGRIQSVQRQPDGSWVGLNATGSKVLTMTRDAARNLVQGYQHIVVVGL